MSLTCFVVNIRQEEALEKVQQFFSRHLFCYICLIQRLDHTLPPITEADRLGFGKLRSFWETPLSTSMMVGGRVAGKELRDSH